MLTGVIGGLALKNAIVGPLATCTDFQLTDTSLQMHFNFDYSMYSGHLTALIVCPRSSAYSFWYSQFYS